MIGLAGPTASGKSAAALAVARALARERPVEIVSVDSALVYQGMDIGTAKPSAAERAEVPHHLIDLIDPRESYSAARFVADARRVVDEIQHRGALPLLVGGTLLYFKALQEGLDAMPGADPAIRAALEARAGLLGWPALHAELAAVDPPTAARLSPTDAQRIQRALEVWQLSGRPLSSFHRHRETVAPFPLIVLEPRSRPWLHDRIAQRFDAMLHAGLLEEVQGLRSRGDLHPGLPSMRCVGYRQTWEWLDAQGAALDSGALRSCRALASPDLPTLRARGIAATRQLAKRQLTWLRSMAHRQVIPCDDPQALNQVVEAVRRLVNTPEAHA